MKAASSADSRADPKVASTVDPLEKSSADSMAGLMAVSMELPWADLMAGY